MPERAHSGAFLRAYLLRTLPEVERDGVECRLLADEAFFEAACAMEADLLADYAAGKLRPKEAAVVRGWLAASAEVRARLALIQALVRRAEGAPGLVLLEA